MSRISLKTPGSIPNHKLQRNLQLNSKFISNDGGDEGISIDNTGKVTISNITTHASGDNYLVEDSGVIKKRTAAETLSDIGAQASLTFGISNTNVTKCGSGIVDNDFIRVDGTTFEGRSASEVLGDIGAQASLTFGIADTNAVKIDSGSVADDEYARFTANGLESRSNAEVLSDIGAIPTANLLDQDDLGDDDASKPASQQSIKAYADGINASLGSAIAAKLNNNADDTMAGTLTIDKNNTATTTSSTYGLKIDHDSTGNAASSNTVSNYGLDIDIDYTGTNAAGSNSKQYGINVDINSSTGSHSSYSGTDNYGLKLNLTGNTSTGDTQQYGVHSTLTGGDVALQVSFYSEAEDGSFDFKAVSSADTGDYFSIATTTHGATTITTVDDNGSAANLTLNVDGDITLNAGTGNITLQNNGGAYTPNSDYEAATKKYVDDNIVTDKWIYVQSFRGYTRYNKWWHPSTTYGITYYNWNSGNLTNLPTVWYDSYNPCLVVPADCTLTEYQFIGNPQYAHTFEFALMKGTGVTYGSAGNYTVSQIGSTQSEVMSAGVLYKKGETGLSVSLSEGEILIPCIRRTTTDTSSYYYFEGNFRVITTLS